MQSPELPAPPSNSPKLEPTIIEMKSTSEFRRLEFLRLTREAQESARTMGRVLLPHERGELQAFYGKAAILAALSSDPEELLFLAKTASLFHPEH